MKIDERAMRPVHGYEEGTGQALDPASLETALAYKKNFLKRFIPLSPDKAAERLGEGRYFVTRKYDGEYAALLFDHGRAVTVNRSGRVRRGIPCIDEAAHLLAQAGVKQAVIPAEIYAGEGKRQGRAGELLAALADEARARELRLALFDIVELNGKPFRPDDYGQTWKMLTAIFLGGERCAPVEMETVASGEEVMQVYRRWVEREGAEGLVVRSEMPFVFKIKPRHSVDAVVVGFTEGTGTLQGRVRSMLLALMPAEGLYQVVGRIGGGMRDELKRTLFERFSSLGTASDYLASDSDHVAFRMIRPVTVVEFTATDVVFEGSSGAVENAQLSFDERRGYRLQATAEGVSFIAPVFVRVREDKQADAGDVRMEQIERFTRFDPAACRTRSAGLPPSTLLLREVYTKQMAGKIMVQKYLVWKTNKEHSPDYPAYVLHYTNFSSGRAEPLRREVKVSSDYAQIMELQAATAEREIKAGWQRLERRAWAAPPPSPTGPGPEPEPHTQPEEGPAREPRQPLPQPVGTPEKGTRRKRKAEPVL